MATIRVNCQDCKAAVEFRETDVTVIDYSTHSGYTYTCLFCGSVTLKITEDGRIATMLTDSGCKRLHMPQLMSDIDSSSILNAAKLDLDSLIEFHYELDQAIDLSELGIS